MKIEIDHIDMLNAIRARLEHELGRCTLDNMGPSRVDAIAREVAQAVIARAGGYGYRLDEPNEHPCEFQLYSNDAKCPRPALAGKLTCSLHSYAEAMILAEARRKGMKP